MKPVLPTIEAEVDLARFSTLEQRILIRMIHACGMTGLSEDVQFWGDAAAAGADAIAAGKPIFVDVEMLRHGIIRSRLTANNPIYCTTHDPRAVPKAAEIGNTRSAAGVDLWEPEDVEGAVVAIGNAPTALFRLMELIEQGLMQKPRALLACLSVLWVRLKVSKRYRIGGLARAYPVLWSRAVAADRPLQQQPSTRSQPRMKALKQRTIVI